MGICSFEDAVNSHHLNIETKNKNLRHFPKFSNSSTRRQQLHVFSPCAWIVPAFSTTGLGERHLSPHLFFSSSSSGRLITNSSSYPVLWFTFVCVWWGLSARHTCHKPRLCWHSSKHDSAYDDQQSERARTSLDALIQTYFTGGRSSSY